MTPPLRVLVAGGGLGGLCLAHGLRAAGLSVSVSVFERDEHRPDPLHSYRIHIDADGSRALHACLPPALWQEFAARSARPPRGIAFVDQRLRRLAFVDEPDPGQAAIARAHPISRAGLRQLLLTGLDDVVLFGKRLVRYQQDSDGSVTAFFADGSTVTGDLLVGADGAHSAVRRQYLPHARVVDSGAAGIAGKFYLTEQTRGCLPPELLSQMTLVLPPRGPALFVAPFLCQPVGAATAPDAQPAVDLPDHLFWSLLGQPQAIGLTGGVRREDGSALQGLACRLVERWHPALQRLVAESDPSTLLSVPLFSAEPVAPWATTTVTLLGDAIHTMTPLQGLGGNTALRDAALLSGHLAAVQRGRADLLPAIHAYEVAMRGYGFGAVRRSLRIAQQTASPSAVRRAAFTTALRVADRVPSLRRRLLRPSHGDPQPAPASA